MMDHQTQAWAQVLVQGTVDRWNDWQRDTGGVRIPPPHVRLVGFGS